MRKCEKRVDVIAGAIIGEALVLSVIEGKPARSSHWRIRCRCGNECTKCTQSIKTLEKQGMPVLCKPCVHKNIADARTKHGHAAGSQHAASPTYSSWESMWKRCSETSHKSYADYGGRGIRVDSVWRDFTIFLRDMGQRPIGTTLGRINNEQGYSATNCRWETMSQQQRNRRSNRLLTLDGVTKTAIEWAESVGLPSTAMYKRLETGWSDKDAILTPMRLYRVDRVKHPTIQRAKIYRIEGRAA